MTIDQRTGAFRKFLEEAVAGTRGAADAVPLPATEQPLLNGLPYFLFRQSTDLKERRLAGTFFSSPKISKRVAALLKAQLADGALVMDPTCGIGDLLLAYAAHLPLEPTLGLTLASWGRQLAGMDLRPELVRMAKLRLVTLAKARGGFDGGAADVDTSFPLITVGDMFDETSRLFIADGFLFNPPFGRTADHAIKGWANGEVNAAAIFLAELVAARRPCAPIAALLPEVLRCGSRYELFRNHLEELGLAGEFLSLGRFDSWTDVDVFLTLLAESVSPTIWRRPEAVGVSDTVGDRFIIRVGAVVPHRHFAAAGHWKPYLCAKTTPAWSLNFEPQSSRRFTGTVFKPPFVVVRRTSSPSDKCRSVGAVVVGANEVAVENHLIVLTPKTGGATACRKLLSVLKAAETSRHLNENMRCRHLTIRSIGSIPWIANID